VLRLTRRRAAAAALARPVAPLAAPPCRRRRAAPLAATARARRGRQDAPAPPAPGSAGRNAAADDSAPSPVSAPLDTPPDFWEGEKWEPLGTFAYVAIFIVAGLAGACACVCSLRRARIRVSEFRNRCAAIAGGVASSTYNSGAVGVDFQAGGSAENALQTAMAAAGLGAGRDGAPPS
jgi:hypothetical protein